jgi:putative membrane protein
MQKPDIFTQLVLCVILGLLPLAVAQTSSIPADSSNSDTHNPKTVLSAADKKFVREAAQGGLAEVELGKLATEKASNDEVKKFGQHMVDDHTKAGDELKEVASSKGIQIAQQLSAKDKLTKERLSKLSGEQFDKAYMADMVKDHTQDVADFERESRSGVNPDVKDFSAKTLPTLKDHLRQAKEIAPMTHTASNSRMQHGQQ